MPHHASAKKRLRQAETRRVHNKGIRSDMRTNMKKLTEACTAGDQATIATAVRTAVSAIDRACKRGVIKKNSAARKKSSVMRQAAGASAN